MPLITFKTITQQSFELEFEGTVTIGEVKQRIQTEKGEKDFPIDGQKLIYNGKVLEDSSTIAGFLALITL
jgi:UV excision repair protein RAD23